MAKTPTPTPAPTPRTPDPTPTPAEIVTYRSRHASYRFGSLRFVDHVATTSDPEVIAAARRSPQFGQGNRFWEETPVPEGAGEQSPGNGAAKGG